MDSKKALAILALGLSLNAAALPQIALGSTTKTGSLHRRQLPGLPLPIPSLSVPAVSSIKPSVAVPSVVPSVSAAANPLGIVTGLTSSLPVVGGTSSPLGAVTGATGSLPAAGALGSVAGAVGSVPVVGGAASGALGTVAGALSPAPVVGGLAAYPTSGGIPGTDPVGAFSISVIATLLSLLKKDPLSLFAPSLPIPGLVKRDLPDLDRAGIPELAKRQLGIPSLSSGIPGIGIGGLAGSGVPGIPPDLAFLVGSIAKNIAVPGGNGLGSITSNILSILNGVVPNFLFQLPVVQDSVPTFGVLQLLASINPTKFGQLGTLNSLPALSIAAAALSPADLSVLKSLPISSDPTNLVTTIMNFSDNVLTLPGAVTNLKAAVAALSLKSLGLAVPGL